jgi:hypothetical protein
MQRCCFSDRLCDILYCGWCCCSCSGGAVFYLADEARDFIIAWISVEYALVPLTRSCVITFSTRDVAEKAKSDQVFRIEIERELERLPRIGCITSFEQRLREHDVPTDVLRLLRQVLTAQRDRLVKIPELSMFVRQRREIASWVLVEFLL